MKFCLLNILTPSRYYIVSYYKIILKERNKLAIVISNLTWTKLEISKRKSREILNLTKINISAAGRTVNRCSQLEKQKL